MTQSTQKKKGRKPKAKMAVVSEPITKSNKAIAEVKETVEKTVASKVEAELKKVEALKVELESTIAEHIAVESEPKKKVYEAEKWIDAHVNTPAPKVTEEKVINKVIVEASDKELTEAWFAVAHQYAEKKSIWQKIVSFFTGK